MLSLNDFPILQYINFSLWNQFNVRAKTFYYNQIMEFYFCLFHLRYSVTIYLCKFFFQIIIDTITRIKRSLWKLYCLINVWWLLYQTFTDYVVSTYILKYWYIKCNWGSMKVLWYNCVLWELILIIFVFKNILTHFEGNWKPKKIQYINLLLQSEYYIERF